MSIMSSLERRFCSSPPWNVIARRLVLPWALQRAALDGRVLEVGAGSGAMAAGLLASHPIAHLTVTDLDPKMVRRAADRLRPFGARADAHVADGTALPFDDDVFDAATSFLMLHHVGRWEAALTELVRVVRPGGRVFVYDLLESRLWRFAHGISRSNGIRNVTAHELGDCLAALPIEHVTVRTRGRLWFRLAFDVTAPREVTAPSPASPHGAARSRIPSA